MDIFISDLHLSEQNLALNELFLDFLQYTKQHAQNLYILGDLVNAWAGPDLASNADQQNFAALKQLSLAGINVFFIPGNRDFLLSEEYLANFDIKVLREPYIYKNKIILLHGDSLCTADINYQKFRKLVRKQWLKKLFLRLPKFLRKKVVATARATSKQATSKKSVEIMDVTEQSVVNCFKQYECKYMIHGHTHRLNMHTYKAGDINLLRIVLGDWQADLGNALLIENSDMQLVNFYKSAKSNQPFKFELKAKAALQ